MRDAATGSPRRLLSPLEPPSLQLLRQLQDDVEPPRGGRFSQSPRKRHVHGIDFACGSTARQHAEQWRTIRRGFVHRWRGILHNREGSFVRTRL